MNRNCDTLFYDDKVFFPLKPFLEETLDERKLFKVGVLPGTILFPDIEESYHLLGEDIKYYNLKDGEGLFLFLEGQAKVTHKSNKLQYAEPKIRIVCELDPKKQKALDDVKEKKKEFEEKIEELLAEIAEEEQFLQRTIKNLDELIEAERNSEFPDPLTIERLQNRKSEAETASAERIARIRCVEAPEGQEPEEEPEAEEDPLPADDATCEDKFKNPTPKFIEDPPPVLERGICGLEKEIERLTQVISVINARHSQEVKEVVESTIRHYIHNTVKISGIKLSIIVKEISTVKEMHKQSADDGVISIEQHYLLAGVKDFSFFEELFFKKPQLYIRFIVEDSITKTVSNSSILECLYPEKSLKDLSDIYFQLQSC
jgi:rubrerythrin